MSLYENWVKSAYNKEGESIKKAWDVYMPLEQKIYEGILEQKITEISGTVAEMAERYNMSMEQVCGFLDGINDASLEPIEVDKLEADHAVSLTLDFEKLYKKMVEYKAQHLYSLPQWDGIFTPEEQKAMYAAQKTSGTVVKEPTPSRNDPCPCGSGKKYKKCCGGAM